MIDIYSEKYLNYLDELHKNKEDIFLPHSFLRNKFPEISRQQSVLILSYWMETFRERHKENGNDNL